MVMFNSCVSLPEGIVSPSVLGHLHAMRIRRYSYIVFNHGGSHGWAKCRPEYWWSLSLSTMLLLCYCYPHVVPTCCISILDVSAASQKSTGEIWNVEENTRKRRKTTLRIWESEHFPDYEKVLQIIEKNIKIMASTMFNHQKCRV